MRVRWFEHVSGHSFSLSVSEIAASVSLSPLSLFCSVCLVQCVCVRVCLSLRLRET